MSFPTKLAGGVAACSLLAACPAMAQSVPTNAQLSALQQQIQALQQQLQMLQNQVAQTQAQAQATAAAQAQTQAAAQKAAAVAPKASEGPKVTETVAHRFGLSSADGRNTIQLTGRVQFDAGDYVDYEPASKSTSPHDLSSGVNARRARLGVVGKFDGDWGYGLIYDFGGSSDTLTNTNSGAPTSGLQNAYVQYNGIKGMTIEGGYIDTPFTLDEATSSNDIMFLERASSEVLAANIAAGDFRSAFGAHWNNDRTWIGVYGTGPTSGAAHSIGTIGGSAEQFGAFGRASYQVLQSADYSLHLGIDVEGLISPPHGAGVRSITLSDRPELRIDPTSIVTTGAIANASDASVYGLEAAAGYRSLFFQGEYYRYLIDRDGAGSLDFDGAYAEASWTVTGEHRKYIPTTGAYSAIVPDHPLEIDENGVRGYGAFELAVRYSYVDLNDDFVSGKSAASTGGIAGGFQQVYTAGVNWYPNSNVRFMLDYLHGDINKASASAATAALGTEIGAKFDAVALRSQINF